jgi:SAM-dependent methyltransferase
MSWDNVWEQIFQESVWGQYPGEDVIRFVARNYYKRDRGQVKILEVGCGPGANIWYMAREGFDVYGIEGSPTAVERCNTRLAKEGLKANVVVGDINVLPYDDNTMDAALDIGCLCCNDAASTAAILAEIYRVLKPGGKFYSRTFTDAQYLGDVEPDPNLEYPAAQDGTLKGKGFIRLTSAETLQQLYGAKFEIESIDKSEFTRENSTQLNSDWGIVCVKPA